jgi:hypothetical protein
MGAAIHCLASVQKSEMEAAVLRAQMGQWKTADLGAPGTVHQGKGFRLAICA